MFSSTSWWNSTSPLVDVYEGVDDVKKSWKTVLQLVKCYRRTHKKFQRSSSKITTICNLPTRRTPDEPKLTSPISFLFLFSSLPLLWKPLPNALKFIYSGENADQYTPLPGFQMDNGYIDRLRVVFQKKIQKNCHLNSKNILSVKKRLGFIT